MTLCAILGASDNTISGWANALEAIYREIGGYGLIFVLLFVFSLTFLILGFLLGRLRHKLRSVDYFKLLRMNLEEQCVSSSFILPFAIFFV